MPSRTARFHRTPPGRGPFRSIGDRSPRPDGSIILALLDESDSTVYSRVLAKPQISDQNAFAQSLEEIRLELAMRSGSIPADMRKALKEQDSVLSYHLA